MKFQILSLLTYLSQFVGGKVEPTAKVDDSIFDCEKASHNVPFLGGVMMSFPNWHNYETAKDKLPKRKSDRFGNGSRYTIFPISSKYIENIQQETFWNVSVAALGRPALKVPKIYGMLIEKCDNQGTLDQLIRGEDYERELGVG